MEDYLRQVDLDEFVKDLNKSELNSFVEESFSRHFPGLSARELVNLYTYDIPKLGPDGTCSITGEKEENPYNLAENLGLEDNPERLGNSFQTLRLWRLNQIVQMVMGSVMPDWFGIYRKIEKKNGEKVLLKEAYSGAFSRPEFPLNEEFAKDSNNSTVGLTGKAVYFGDLSSYSGPYYECDDKVQSEYCGPILGSGGEVIGIVDAESFQKDFFTPDRILQLTKVCRDLGKINLGL